MKNDILKALLESVIFDLESILSSSREEYTIGVLMNVIEALKAIKEDTENKQLKSLIKRLLYKRMTDIRQSNPQESKELYNIYQKFKVGSIETEEVINLLNSSKISSERGDR